MEDIEHKREIILKTLVDILVFNGWEQKKTNPMIAGFSLGENEIYFPSSPEVNEITTSEVGFTNGEDTLYFSLNQICNITKSYIETEKERIFISFCSIENNTPTEKRSIYLSELNLNQEDNSNDSERYYFTFKTEEEIQEDILFHKVVVTLLNNNWQQLFIKHINNFENFYVRWKKRTLSNYYLDFYDGNSLVYVSPKEQVRIELKDVIKLLDNKIISKNGEVIVL